jgi:hypothetical protein
MEEISPMTDYDRGYDHDQAQQGWHYGALQVLAFALPAAYRHMPVAF